MKIPFKHFVHGYTFRPDQEGEIMKALKINVDMRVSFRVIKKQHFKLAKL